MALILLADPKASLPNGSFCCPNPLFPPKASKPPSKPEDALKLSSNPERIVLVVVIFPANGSLPKSSLPGCKYYNTYKICLYI